MTRRWGRIRPTAVHEYKAQLFKRSVHGLPMIYMPPSFVCILRLPSTADARLRESDKHHRRKTKITCACPEPELRGHCLELLRCYGSELHTVIVDKSDPTKALGIIVDNVVE